MLGQIKINRSRKLSPELYGKADEAIMESISQPLFEQLTGSQLAEVRRCLNAHWHKARQFERNEILAEGGLWSNSAQKFRELQ
jgi:hypothetical protein